MKRTAFNFNNLSGMFSYNPIIINHFWNIQQKVECKLFLPEVKEISIARVLQPEKNKNRQAKFLILVKSSLSSEKNGDKNTPCKYEMKT